MPPAAGDNNEMRIQFTIRRENVRASPSSGDAGDASDIDTCHICAHEFCLEDACGRAPTTLKCCTQPLCCSCLAKMVKRCRCSDDCEAVIALCPFCREVCPVTTLDLFLGSRPACKACAAKDPGVHTQPQGQPRDHQRNGDDVNVADAAGTDAAGTDDGGTDDGGTDDGGTDDDGSDDDGTSDIESQ